MVSLLSFTMMKYTEPNNCNGLAWIVVGQIFWRVNRTLPLSVCLSKRGKGNKENRSVSLTTCYSEYIPFSPSVFMFLDFSSVHVHHKFVIWRVIYLQGTMLCCAHSPDLVPNELPALSSCDSAWVGGCFSVGSTSQRGLFAARMSLLCCFVRTDMWRMRETGPYCKIGCAVCSVSFHLLASRRESTQDKIEVPHATIQLSS